MKFSIVNVLVSGLLLAAASVDACQCKVGSRQGQYCGHCEAVLVTPDFVYDHVYECNPSGGCFDYGERNDCKQSNNPCPF
ncbi:mold-specific M46 protein [Histoplasma ohiense]|uniref:M46 protein n=2 Tax=Ajellomyces capsulatus TaxID=5037 RepID=Q96UL9_AJECA|nr:mold-specific M46 protein [Histoplasma capsulatum]AIS67843.1 M46 protein [Histoplasma capsulatum]KAG5295277.1 mold-specific M46 protein [Histoplasma ohiense (nom. inval.)]QSS49662.1 mold-specific M46 protein [Histoplasma capsulatum var. duboisii H88]